MDSQLCYEPDSPPSLPGRWLRLAHRRSVYAPHVVRVRKRVFSTDLIETFDKGRRPHAHTIYHFVYILDGSNTISIADGDIEVRRGQLVLIDPDVPHDLIPRRPHDFAFLTFMFCYRCGGRDLHLPFPRLIELVTGASVAPATVVEDVGAKLRAYFACLEEDVLGRRTGRVERSAYCLAGIFNELIGIRLRTSDAPPVPDDVLAARTFLSESVDREVTIADLMRVTHLSRSHLLEKFRRYVGVSPIEYLIRERIEKSKTLLVGSSRRIKEIAALCGFNSEYYFDKTFKKRTRMTPGEFRRAHRGMVE